MATTLNRTTDLPILEFLAAKGAVTAQDLKTQLYDPSMSQSLPQPAFVHRVQELIAGNHISSTTEGNLTTLQITARGRQIALPMLRR